MAILVPGLRNSEAPNLLDAIEFLSNIAGLVSEDVDKFAQSFSPEEAADLVSLATILNRGDDFSMTRLAIRERIKGGVRAKEAFLQHCNAFKTRTRYEQDFAEVLGPVRERLLGVVTA